MRYSWCKVLLAVALVVFPTSLVFAANGKITGVVKDASSGDPVVSANIVIQGTGLGGAANVEGVYYILNVPPGNYTIVASAVGYAKAIVQNVKVVADQIVTVDVALKSEAIGLAEVVIEAEQRVVDKSLTATKTTIGRDEVANVLPVTSAVEILNTTPGAFKGFVRGGRINESKTIIDGVDVTDMWYAAAAQQSSGSVFTVYGNVPPPKGSDLSTIINLANSSIEQLSVNTGAVGAEYSSATAGVINYSLRNAKSEWSGGLFTRVSQFNGLKYVGPDAYWNENVYFNERSVLSRRVDSLRQLRADGKPASQYTTLSRDSVRLGWYTYEHNKYNNQDAPTFEIEGNLAGDVMPGWSLLLSGRYHNSNSRLPNEKTQDANITVKSNLELASGMRLSAFSIINDQGRLFGWKNREYQEGMRFFLEGVPVYATGTIIGSGKFTHVLSPSTFYEVQLSVNDTRRQQGYVDGNGDGIVSLNEDGDFITMDNLADYPKYLGQTYNSGKFFRYRDEQESQTDYAFLANGARPRLARPTFFYEDRSNSVTTLKGDFTSQITGNHQVKAGGQARLHNIDMKRRFTVNSEVDANMPYFEEIWNVKPKEFGLYLSDRIEYAGLIINLGGRLDIFDRDASEFANYWDPFVRKLSPADSNGITVYRFAVDNTRGDKLKTDLFFSPRVGVSHPITEYAAMYFSFSRNFTPPPFSRLYIFYDSPGNNSLPNMVSLKQEAYKSANYELGVQWEFIPRKFGLNFTAYLRDIDNYSTAAYSVFTKSGQVAYNTSWGYADARGIEVSLQALPQTYFDFITLSGRVNYAYTYIKAASLAGLDASMITSFSVADSTKYNYQLPWENLKFYNTIETNVQGGTSTLSGGYDRSHRITYTLLLNFPYEVRLTSIGTFQSGFYYAQTLVDPRVAGRELGQAPWNKQVDVRLEKGFKLGNVYMSVFADVKNLFNWENILAYDRTTTGTTLWETSVKAGNPDPTGTLKRPVSSDDGSYFYDIPREWYVGARIEF